MTMYAIDTLEFAKKLRTAGLAQDQAEAIAEAHGQAFREAAEHTLATKQDLAKHPTTAEVEQMLDKALEPYATKQDLAEVKHELKADIKVLKWGMGIVIAAVLIPALKDLLPLIG